MQKNGLKRHKADALTHFLFKNPLVVLKKHPDRGCGHGLTD
jgi:hypothetical protein